VLERCDVGAISIGCPLTILSDLFIDLSSAREIRCYNSRFILKIPNVRNGTCLAHAGMVSVQRVRDV
jgi:hypothetical protein